LDAAIQSLPWRPRVMRCPEKLSVSVQTRGLE